MILFIKALFLALADVLKLWANIGKLIVELFWAIAGIVGLILSIVLFPLIVARKMKNLSEGSAKRKKSRRA